jgi:hypothetical protein
MENRVKRLETITDRLMRRAKKRASIIIPPSSISHVVIGDDIQGIIFRYMFPCDGTVYKGVVRFDHKPKTDVFLNVRLFNDEDSQSTGFNINRKIVSKHIGIDVKEGDCLSVTIEPDSEILTEVWLSFTFIPTIRDSSAKSFLIDELENVRSNFEQSAIEDENA